MAGSHPKPPTMRCHRRITGQAVVVAVIRVVGQFASAGGRLLR